MVSPNNEPFFDLPFEPVRSGTDQRPPSSVGRAFPW